MKNPECFVRIIFVLTVLSS